MSSDVSAERKIAVEEVDNVASPPKARVAAHRQPDYLEGFLSERPREEGAGEPGGAIYEGVLTALKEIYDPEIPVNIYELGLVYGVEVTDDGHVVVTMTLTTPHCPV